MGLNIFSASHLDELTLHAKNSPRLRQHLNIHTDFIDPCQRLLNAIEPNSYIRPHRHGVETLFAIRGLMALFIFTDSGAIERVQCFSNDLSRNNRDIVFGAEIPQDRWHTVVSLETGSILLEVKAGPFNPDAPKTFAPWSPEEGASERINYLKRLMRKLD